MLLKRFLTAVVLLSFMFAALLLLSPEAWSGLSWLIVLVALWEFSRMAGMSGAGTWMYLIISSALAVAAWLAHYRMSPLEYFLTLAFWFLLVPCWLIKRWRIPQGAAAWLLGWLLMLPTWFAFLEWRPQSGAANAIALLVLMGLVWVADITAYFSGKAFGRHQLAPMLSPGKSWEGVCGGVICVTLYVALVDYLGWIAVDLPRWALLLLGLLLSAVSVMGDLLESWFKRASGIKDSSALLPGHGGVYDRIDSLIAVLVVSNALRALGDM